MILTRRLELQLSEMDKAEESLGTNTPVKSPSGTNTPMKSTDSLGAFVLEDDADKERTIAKAALSIAELCSYSHLRRLSYVAQQLTTVDYSVTS